MSITPLFLSLSFSFSPSECVNCTQTPNQNIKFQIRFDVNFHLPCQSHQRPNNLFCDLYCFEACSLDFPKLEGTHRSVYASARFRRISKWCQMFSICWMNFAWNNMNTILITIDCSHGVLICSLGARLPRDHFPLLLHRNE